MANSFVAKLEACSTLQEVGAALVFEIARHGYTVSACGAFLPTDKGPETHFFFQNWPADWIGLYRERNFVAIDFSVAEARRRIAPFTWLEAKAERSLSRAEEELWDTANHWGWADGLSVPIHGPAGYFGLVTMGGPALEMTPALRQELHMLAFLTHERCRKLSGLDPVQAPGITLTVRELECLRWVASGKTDWEIGAILGLSGATVKTYVDQARDKLGARTRSQAVARMVFCGLS